MVVGLLVLAVSSVVTWAGRHDEPSRHLIQPPAGSVRTVPLDVADRAAPGRATWAPWPQALHDASHSGSAVVDGPRRGEIAWRRHLGDGAVPGGPVVGADGTIYVVDAAGSLHAIRSDNGHDRWQVDTGAPVSGDLSTSPLVLPDGDVVAADTDGLAAWDPTGKPRWHLALPGPLTSPATTDGNRLYVGSRSGAVSAIDVIDHTATVAWRLDLGMGQSYGSVVTDGAGRVYQTSMSGLVAVDDEGDHASVAWTADPDDGVVEVSAGLSPTGDTVLLGTNGHHEWAYGRGGNLLWSAPREITYSSPSVTFDGLAVVGEHDDRVHVFAVATGAQVGLFPSTVVRVSGKTRVWTSVVVDRDHDLYFGTRTHYLVGVAPDGTRLLTVDLGASTSSYPALTADHAVVIGTDEGDLVKVE